MPSHDPEICWSFASATSNPTSILLDPYLKALFVAWRPLKRGKINTEVLVSRQRRRNAIEPTIGHMKDDGWLGRNYLKGTKGDQVNALLCGVGQNLRAILRHLRIFWLRFLVATIKQILRSNMIGARAY